MKNKKRLLSKVLKIHKLLQEAYDISEGSDEIQQCIDMALDYIEKPFIDNLI